MSALRLRLTEIEMALEEVEIKIPVLEKPELLKRSLDHYTFLYKRPYNTEIPKFDNVIKDVCVKMLRHRYTDYDRIKAAYRKTPYAECVTHYRNRILKEISSVYPFLKSQCDDQMFDIYQKERYQ